MRTSSYCMNDFPVSTIESIRTLAQEANTPAEDASIAQAILIGHRHRHPYYKHVIRRFELARARKRLASFQDGGMRLLQYVHDAKVELKDYKVIHFVDLLRKLKPKMVYEFGAGGSTCLIAEILAENSTPLSSPKITTKGCRMCFPRNYAPT